jgi:hypothetical protein
MEKQEFGLINGINIAIWLILNLCLWKKCKSPNIVTPDKVVVLIVKQKYVETLVDA